MNKNDFIIGTPLENCPFCGGKAMLTYTTTSTPHPFIQCTTPDCPIQQYPFKYNDKEEAISQWNRRVSND